MRIFQQVCQGQWVGSLCTWIHTWNPIHVELRHSFVWKEFPWHVLSRSPHAIAVSLASYTCFWLSRCWGYPEPLFYFLWHQGCWCLGRAFLGGLLDSSPWFTLEISLWRLLWLSTQGAHPLCCLNGYPNSSESSDGSLVWVISRGRLSGISFIAFLK